MLPLFSSSGSDDCSALKTQADRCRNQKHLTVLWGTSARRAFVRRRSLVQCLLLALSGHSKIVDQFGGKADTEVKSFNFRF